MDKNKILKTLEQVRKNSRKRNFNQTFDIAINLRSYDIKRDGNIDLFVTLPYNVKKVKVCALVGKELAEKARIFDNVIKDDEFGKYRDKKLMRKIAKDYDFFIAQADLMPKIAAVFGKVLGPKGKMPNPKSGCIVPATSELKPLKERLENSMRIRAINRAEIKCAVGKENMKDDEIADNIMAVYNSLVHALPKEEESVGDIRVKLTMGPSVKIGEEVKEK